MRSCREMTRLISESLDRKLTFRERLELRFHVLMCGVCRRFRSNVLAIRRKLRAIPAEQRLRLRGDLASKREELTQQASRPKDGAMPEPVRRRIAAKLQEHID